MVKQVKVLFVCHGNICRSTMAQSIFTYLARNKGVLDEFEIDSAATSTEELGNPMYPPAVRALTKHGIPIVDHRARQMTRDDYKHFDHIVIMDSENHRNVMRMTGNDPDGKVVWLLDRAVADPWWTGEFETTYEDILEGCSDLLEKLLDYRFSRR